MTHPEAILANDDRNDRDPGAWKWWMAVILAWLLIGVACCYGGKRDPQFSSVGRPNWWVKVVQKRDGYSMTRLDWVPVLDIEYVQGGKTVSDSLFVSEAEWDRVKVGRTYLLVRNRGIKCKDPNAIEWKGDN